MARKIKRKDKKRSKVKIKNQNFINILRNVHLGGIIEECLVDVNKGKAKIEAVDITESIIIITKANIMPKSSTMELGLGNLELLIKFLSTLDDSDINFNLSESYFTLKRSDSRRKLEYLLTQPEFISTKLNIEDDNEDPYKKMVGLTDISAELTSTFIKDYLNYVGMLKTKDTTIKTGEELTFICGGIDDHQFELVLSSDLEGDEDDAFENKVNGEHMAKILSTIEFDEDEPPIIMLAENAPVIIENANTIWALMPLYDIQDTDEDEEDD